MTKDDQMQLVQRSLAGDASAFEQLYKFSRHSVVAAIGTICSVEDRDDYVQDAFVQIYRNLGKFAGDAAFTTWAFAVARNVALMRLRQRKHRQDLEVYSIDEPVNEETGAHFEVPYIAPEYEFAGDLQKLRVCIQSLAPCYRDVATLKLQEWEHQDIAEKLGIQVGTSKSHWHKALLRLRKMMNMSTCIPCQQEGNGTVLANHDADPATGRVAMCHDHYARATAGVVEPSPERVHEIVEEFREKADETERAPTPAVIETDRAKSGYCYSDADRAEVRKLLLEGIDARTVSNRTGVGIATVYNIRRPIFDQLPPTKWPDDYNPRCECGKPARHAGACPGKPRRAKIWSEEDATEFRRRVEAQHPATVQPPPIAPLVSKYDAVIADLTQKRNDIDKAIEVLRGLAVGV